MSSDFTNSELQLLVESLTYSIMNVENSKSHDHSHPQKPEKLEQLQDLRTKIRSMVKES